MTIVSFRLDCFRRPTAGRALLSVLIAGLALNTVPTVHGQGDSRPKPVVPPLAEASGEAETAIRSFKVPDGMACKLFAAEPLFGNPVAFGIDRQGRVYVCESYRQNKGVTDNRGHDDKWLDADLAAKTVQDRIDYHRKLLGKEAAEYETYDDLIRVLVDTDQDGKADKATVFANGFNGIEEGTGAGVLIRDDQVLYTNIPKLWSLRDSDGDGVADKRIVFSDGYGVRVAFRGHDMHGLVMGPDGRVYFSIGDRGYSIQTPAGKIENPESGAVFRCELDGSNLSVFATGLRNPQELAFDDEGNLFTCDNNSDSGDKARWVHVIPGGDTGWRMMYQYLSDRGPFNREKIWYPLNEDTPAYIVPPIANISDGPSGLVCYPGVGLDGSESLKNTFFLCDFRGQASNSGVRRIQMKPKGATFEISKNEEFVWNMLVTDVDFTPEGNMLISDWVNGWNGENKGRLYSIEPTANAKQNGLESAAILKKGFSKLADEELASLLKNRDRRIRFEAQYELAKRGKTNLFASILANSKSRTEKLHAIWGLGQIARNAKDDIAQTALSSVLGSEDEYVAARACEMLAESKGDLPAKQLDALLMHPSSVVRLQALLAVSQRKAISCFSNVIQNLVINQDADPVLRHAGIVALAAIINDENIERALLHSNESVRVATAVALRRTHNPKLANLLQDASIRVVREAARGIYDVVENHAALPELAKLTIAKEFDDVIVLRVLHANYRLGQAENIERLTQFVLSSTANEKMRLEALSLLSEWGKPGLREKVLNRHMPLDDRSVEPVITSLQANLAALSATPENVRDRFFQVGAKFGMKEISQQLALIAKDGRASPSRRADAILALSSLKPEDFLSIRSDLAQDKSPEVRIAAWKATVKTKPTESIPYLQTGMTSNIQIERQAAWDLISKVDSAEAIAAIDQGAEALFNQMLPKDTWLNAQEAIAAKGSAEWKEKISKLSADRAASQESNPREAFADCIEGGSIEAGRELFFTRSNLSCVRCHRVGDIGGEVGPNLSQLGKQKDSGYLLEAIVAPNTAIAQGFETVVLLTDDDESITGILKQETDSSLKIMDAQGAMIEVDKDSIVSRKKGLSSMPADLLKYLNRRELRDLVAYLASLDGSPESTKKFGEVGGHAEK